MWWADRQTGTVRWWFETHTHRDVMGRRGEMRDTERKAMEKGKLSLKRITWDGTREGQ